jgi:formate-dependent nitrite reductase membrane component NrfD
MTSSHSATQNSINAYAIAGFVLSLFCCAPLGITFSAVALSQMSHNPDQEGKGLAVAGLTIGVASLIIGISIFLISLSSPFWSEFWSGFMVGFEEGIYDNNTWI